jgi:hypothetical protein
MFFSFFSVYFLSNFEAEQDTEQEESAHTEIDIDSTPRKSIPVPNDYEASPSSSNIDKLWKTDPWAALHSIVGIFII